MSKSAETRAWIQFVFDNMGYVILFVVAILLLVGFLKFEEVKPAVDWLIENIKALRG